MAGVVQGVDLSPIIDRQKIGAFHVKLIAIAFLVVMADGYDIGAAAFAAPALIREWHVAPGRLAECSVRASSPGSSARSS
jgi:hypothetical protein